MPGRSMMTAVAAVAVTFLAARPATAQHTGNTRLAFVAGAGGVFSLAQPGFDRSTGAQYLVGLEFAQPWRRGTAGRLALRLEGGFAQQSLSSNGAIGGNVQTVHVAALALWSMTSVDRSLVPYLLGGPVWARPSTRVALDAAGAPTPGATFQETTHETALGAELGVGTGWRAGIATVRLEVHWTLLATNSRSTSMLPVGLSIALPLN